MKDFELEEIAVNFAYQVYKKYYKIFREGKSVTDREKVSDIVSDKEICFGLLRDKIERSTYIQDCQKAHDICQHCDIQHGEEYLRDRYDLEDGWTYNKIASFIACGEICYRSEIHLNDFFDDPSKYEAAQFVMESAA